MTTPVLTQHARERCAEMGISTKVAKRIVQGARTIYPGRNTHGGNSTVALCPDYPEYAVVFAVEGDLPPVIVTVLFNTPDRYVRAGETYSSL